VKHNEISRIIIDTALDVHRRLGPGLLESVYQAVLLYELVKRGLRVEKEVAVPVLWDDMKLDVGLTSSYNSTA